MKNKLLVIAYVFPPIAYAGTYRTVRLCKYLARMDYDITVLTIKEQADIHNDHRLVEEIASTTQIVRTKTIDFWRNYQKIKSNILSLPLGKILNRLICIPLNVINQPDHMVLWVPFAVIKGYRLIKKNQIPVIYTTSPPHSEHLIGYVLKKLTGVKWIADLRDPILDNIAAGSWSMYEKKINTWLEHRIVHSSDAVITNTLSAKEKLESRYKSKKIFLVYNSFDEEEFHNLPKNKYDHFTITHVGTIYNFRKVDLILKAIQTLHEKKHINPSDFSLFFIGLNEASLKKEVEKYKVGEFVKIMEMVSHDDAIRTMVESHLLLLIKGFGENSECHIPGKLYEYLGAQNKIIYLGPSDSESAEIIRNADAGYIIENDLKKLCDILLNEYRSSGVKNKTGNHDASLSKHMSSTMAKHFDAIFQAVSKNNAIA